MQKTIILSFCIAAFFVIDLSQFFLLGYVYIPFLLCLYWTLLFYNAPIIQLITLLFLQCIETFCFYNNLSLPLIYLFPASGAAIIMKKNFYPSLLHPILFVVISFFGISRQPCCTLIQISAIILVEICFSLTIKQWGMLNNRA